MGIAQATRPLFSSDVRRRGADYADMGAVEIVQCDDGWAVIEVEGSYGASYHVTLGKLDNGRFDLECTCPHFDEGNYCKHLWASVLIADKVDLFDSGASAASYDEHVRTPSQPQPKPAAKPTSWKKQLDRQSRYLPRQSALISAVRPQRAYYLLEVGEDNDQLVVGLHCQQRRKDGAWGAIKPLAIDHDDLDDGDLALSDEYDRLALAKLLSNRLQASPYDDGYYAHSSRFATQVEISPLLYESVLPALAATGRFVWLLSEEQGWDAARGVQWDDGPAWRFQLRAESIDRDDQWRLTGELVRGEETRPLGDAIRCFRSGLVLIDDQLGRFEAPGDYRWVETLRANDELLVAHEDRESLLKELWRASDPPKLVGDESLRLPHEVGAPVGHLTVHSPEKLPSYARSRSLPLYANVSYRYGGHEATPNSPAGGWLSDEQDRMVSRNLVAEKALFDRLLELGCEPKAISYIGHTPPGHVQFSPGRLTALVEALVPEGWIVKAEGVRIRHGGGVSVSVKSGVDWFDLEGEAQFDGESVALPKLLAALRAGERYVQLSDGSRGLLPQKWLEQFTPLADVATQEQGGTLRFQTSQALLLDSLLAARESEVGVAIDQQFKAWRKRLQSFAGVKPAAAPQSFRGELRDYQKEGLGWLRFLEKFGFGGCLADDMGLGKTIQVLALLAGRRRRTPKDAEQRPALVVAPKSLVHNWRLEAERFAPRLAVADYTGLDRRRRVADFGEYDLVITTYGTLRQDASRLGETAWDYAVLDEAQAIKNAASQSAKASRLLKARHRLALSGTPVENHLGELWSIFEFLNPGLLGKSQTLTKLHRGGGDNQADEVRLAALRQGIAPFLLRRTKQQVLPQLPKKTEQELYCDLPPAQRKQYNELRDHYRALLTEKIDQSSLAQAKIHVLEALLRLRQASCHPGLIDARQKSKPSAKLGLLMEQMSEVVSEGHKVLVFSQFTTMLDIVRNRMDKAGVVYEYLDGKTNNRQQRVDRFQTNEACQAFLISLKAGGCGLNLTAADYVFLLDPWWNPAVEAQAIDRAHRIGQERPVFAYRLIARDTVEEKILQLQATKRELADAIISTDSSLLKSLTADDLQLLLS